MGSTAVFTDRRRRREARPLASPEAAPSVPIAVRPIRPSDATALERFYEALSEDSRRTRFFAVTRGLSHGQSAAFCTTDHAHREGFVAVMRPDRRRAERIVGHLCLEPADDGSAEMAVAVADSLQGQGIGRQLVEAGIAWARAAGLRRLSATMLATNTPIHRLVVSLGMPTTRRAVEPDVVSVTVELSSGRAGGVAA